MSNDFLDVRIKTCVQCPKNIQPSFITIHTTTYTKEGISNKASTRRSSSFFVFLSEVACENGIARAIASKEVV